MSEAASAKRWLTRAPFAGANYSATRSSCLPSLRPSNSRHSVAGAGVPTTSSNCGNLDQGRPIDQDRSVQEARLFQPCSTTLLNFENEPSLRQIAVPQRGQRTSIWPTYEAGRDQRATQRDCWSVQVPALKYFVRSVEAHVQLGSRRQRGSRRAAGGGHCSGTPALRMPSRTRSIWTRYVRSVRFIICNPWPSESDLGTQSFSHGLRCQR